MTGYYVKNPGSALDVNVDWAQQFLSPGEVISTDLGWTVRPDVAASGGLVVVSQSASSTVTTARLSAGTPGDAYLVTSAIETNQGREIRRSLTVRIAHI